MKLFKNRHIWLLNSLLLISTVISAKEKLEFSIDLVRHGDRSSICELPKSRLNPDRGIGQLTELGKIQEFTLGQELRQRYLIQEKLLPTQYDPASMYVRSTDRTRTVESARALLSGLYPKQYQAIEINKVPRKSDTLLIAAPGTSEFKLMDRDPRMSKLWNDLKVKYGEKITVWSQIVGLDLTQPNGFVCFGDNLYIRLDHNQPLPTAITLEDAKLVMQLTKQFILKSFNQYMFAMGPEFVKNANQYLQSAAKKPGKLKYVLYTAHDSSILSVLHALGVPLTQMPPYASRLNFSLYSDGKKQTIKVTYNNKVLKIPGCQASGCSLKEFQVKTRQLT